MDDTKLSLYTWSLATEADLEDFVYLLLCSKGEPAEMIPMLLFCYHVTFDSRQHVQQPQILPPTPSTYSYYSRFRQRKATSLRSLSLRQVFHVCSVGICSRKADLSMERSNFSTPPPPILSTLYLNTFLYSRHIGWGPTWDLEYSGHRKASPRSPAEGTKLTHVYPEAVLLPSLVTPPSDWAQHSKVPTPSWGFGTPLRVTLPPYQPGKKCS